MAPSTIYNMSASNLAILGILEEAYDIYNEAIEFCNSIVNANIIRKFEGRCWFAQFPGLFNGEQRITDLMLINTIQKRCQEAFAPEIEQFFRNNIIYFSDRFPENGIKKVKWERIFTFFPFETSGTDIVINSRSIPAIKVTVKRFSTFLRMCEGMLACAIECDSTKNTSHDYETIVNSINTRIQIAVDLQRRMQISDSTEELFDQTLRIFKSLTSISCREKKHKIISDVATIPTLCGKSVELPIHKCQTCGKLFIGEQTLEQYSKEYGKLLVHTVTDTAISDYSSFAEESELHALGYNVVDGEMTDKERQRLLLTLINSGYISYFAAVRDIEKAINLFKHNERFSLALSKWRADLKLIGDNELKKKS